MLLARGESLGDLKRRIPRVHPGGYLDIGIVFAIIHVDTKKVDPGAGFEPAPTRSEAERSTAELPRNTIASVLTVFMPIRQRRSATLNFRFAF